MVRKSRRSVEEQQPAATSSAHRQRPAEHHAAVAAKHKRHVAGVEHRPDRVGECDGVCRDLWRVEHAAHRIANTGLAEARRPHRCVRLAPAPGRARVERRRVARLRRGAGRGPRALGRQRIGAPRQLSQASCRACHAPNVGTRRTSPTADKRTVTRRPRDSLPSLPCDCGSDRRASAREGAAAGQMSRSGLLLSLTGERLRTHDPDPATRGVEGRRDLVRKQQAGGSGTAQNNSPTGLDPHVT